MVSPISTQAELDGAVGPPISGASAAQCGALSPEVLEARAAGPLPAATQGVAADGFEASQGQPRRGALPGTAEGGWRRGDREEPTAAQMLHSLSCSWVAGAAPATQPNIFHLATEITAV